MNTPTSEQPIETLLREVFAKTDVRDYSGAFAILEIARRADPGNIYISALKRQLDSLALNDHGDGLPEDRRRELMEPMPGIIECALRDSQRLSRSGITSTLHAQPPVQHDVPRAAHTSVDDEARKELEALKLLYFQRASKFVMKGEYELALAEVQRVFIVDPENTIAKEYANRVENLIQHARRLAAAPTDDGATASDAAMRKPASVPPQPSMDDHHSTAWTADFGSPGEAPPPSVQQPASQRRPGQPASERRPESSPSQRQPTSQRRPVQPASERRPESSASQRQPASQRNPGSAESRLTLAYGDSLAIPLDAQSEADAMAGSDKPVRSRRTMLLVAVIATLFIGGGTFAILSTMSAGTSGDGAMIKGQTLSSDFSSQAVGTIVAPSTPASEQNQQLNAPVQHSPVSLPGSAPGPSPAVNQKPKTEMPPVASDAAKLALQQESQPLPAEKRDNVTPAPVEIPPAVPEVAPAETPAFVAVEKEPQIVKLEKPQFPGFVWKTGIEGQVVVKVLIDTEGKPIDTQILKSTNSVFDEPVIDAVMRSQFSPAQMGQGPVTAWITIPFRFKQPK